MPDPTKAAQSVWMFEPAWQALVAAETAYRTAHAAREQARREWDRVREARPHLFPPQAVQPATVAQAGEVELPEPYASHAIWSRDADTVAWDQWHTKDDPLPEPEDWEGDPPDQVIDVHTSAELRAYGDAREAAARQEALEEAAKVCDAKVYAISNGGDSYYRPATADQCAAAIRALIGKD